MTTTNKQPLPVGGEQNVFEYIRKLVDAREEYGIKEYGQPLHTFDGRDNNRDTDEEFVDFFAYGMKTILEQRRIVERLLELCPELTEEWMKKKVKPEALIDYVIKKYTGHNEQ